MNRYKSLKVKVITSFIIILFVMTFVTFCMNDISFNENEENILVMQQYINEYGNTSNIDENASSIDGYLFASTQKFTKNIIVYELNVRNASHSFVITDRITENRLHSSNNDDDGFIRVVFMPAVFTTSFYYIFHMVRKWFTSNVFCLSFLIELVITYIHKRDGKKRGPLIIFN